MSMASASWPISPDPLADAVVPESVMHSRTSRLVAQVVSLAVADGPSEPVERLGLRWPDGPTSSPDFFLMPGGAISWATTSYAPGIDGPLPEVAVEIVSSSLPNIARLFTRDVLTYLVYLDPPNVLRVDPRSRIAAEVPDGEPIEQLGGVAFVRGEDRVGVVDPNGHTWWDPEDHLRSLDAARRSLAAERNDLAAERNDLAAERNDLQQERDQLLARLAELEGRAG